MDLEDSAAAYGSSCRDCKLKDQLTLVCEAVSKKRGWCALADGIG